MSMPLIRYKTKSSRLSVTTPSVKKMLLNQVQVQNQKMIIWTRIGFNVADKYKTKRSWLETRKISTSLIKEINTGKQHKQLAWWSAALTPGSNAAFPHPRSLATIDRSVVSDNASGSDDNLRIKIHHTRMRGLPESTTYLQLIFLFIYLFQPVDSGAKRWGKKIIRHVKAPKRD
ncbi:uncharacterized protein LOC114365011 [Ostrinia furnacalis]|uniref:uncharacterized protein LOC114365011 n=1 Tax=Ostrinia furnacalis TaxID=93504 RepID=UPI0010409860|nr:uncharacterized protein LOC114365011 [Ostrinia furnacalis]